MRKTLLAAFIIMDFTAYAQNVGIGTSNPQQKLEVAGWIELGNESEGTGGTAGSIRYHTLGKIQYYNGTQWLDLATPDDDWRKISGTGLPIIGDQMYHTGDVAIGSSSAPTAKLHVTGPATGTGVTIRAGGGGDVVLNAGGSLFFDGNYDYGAGNYIRPVSANTQAFVTAGSERMRITSSGNIGIGTATPQQKLEVAGWVELGNESEGTTGTSGALRYHSTGKIQFYNGTQWVDLAPADDDWRKTSGSGLPIISDQMYHTGDVAVGSSSTPGAKLDVTGPATGSGITIRAGGGGDVVLNSGGSVFFDGNYSYASGNYIRPMAANTQAFFTSGAERMRITSGGNVGVGTTAPTGKFDVVGDIYGVNEFSFTGYSDAINNWDYTGLSINPSGNSVGDDSWYIVSTASNWDRGVMSKRRFSRTPGLTLEYEVWMDQPGGGNVHYMVGFVDGNATAYTYCQTPSNLLYHDHSGLSAYENCSGQGSDYSFDSRSAWWKFKVVLKGQGADYYVFRDNTWNRIKSTTNNSNRYLRVLITAYNNRLHVRNMRVYQQSSDNEGLSSGYIKNQISSVQPSSNFFISGIGQTSGDMRAPIFYDYNNTGYYVDPNDISNTNDFRANAVRTTYLDFRHAGGNSGNGGHAYAIFQEGGDWTHPYPDLRIAYHTGIKLGAYSGYNGIRFYNDYDMSGLVMSVNDASTGGTNNVYMAGTLGIGQANTSYRLTVGGDAYVNGGWVRVTGNQGLYFESYGGGLYMVDGSWIRTYGSKNFYHDAGSFRTDGQLEVGGGGATLYCTNGGNMAYRSNVLFANTAGRVGINSTDPKTTFDAYGPCFTGADLTYHAVSGTYSGYDVLVYPSINGTGYCGAGSAWYRVYSYGFVNASRKEKKRDLTPIAEDLGDYVMADIDKLQPYFYKYKDETDEMQIGNENRYRPQMHIGLLVDEAPDYLKDESHTGIEIYGVASLAIAGVKHNYNEINKLKEVVAQQSGSLQDFGTATMDGKEKWIPFSADFKDKLAAGAKPVISLTPNQFVQLIVSEKNGNGFRIKANTDVTDLEIDWTASVKQENTFASLSTSIGTSLPTALQNQLIVPQAEKQILTEYWKREHEKIQTRDKVQ